ncbi:unnamed protein product [Notodromas monacha]|uniref:Uncharacterized protein n=1 Tax=Notodromas monacha TaxID=399045 RepID=A0A7R9BWE0_9CRUS|nr:unnamed protein product [Notodromas monacha]CAG0921629.1 unnamed protein product [Notodromas monacha]
MGDFAEKSGIVALETDWGRWWQTGKLRDTVRGDETVWTLEDGVLLRIVLVKATDFANSEKVWESLLDGKYVATPEVYFAMQKKLDLEKFQMENPGFDFSSAELDAKFDKIPSSVVKQLQNAQQSGSS